VPIEQAAAPGAPPAPESPKTPDVQGERYKKPPQPILDILNAEPFPLASLSPARDVLLLATPLRYPPIAELARPMLRLAGVRIDPQNSAIHHAQTYTGLRLVRIADGRTTALELPDRARVGSFAWSPDGARFAFTLVTARELQLYAGSVAEGSVRRILGVALNAALGGPIDWLPDGRTLLVRVIPPDRGAPPPPPAAPRGPAVQETHGAAAPSVTFTDLLSNREDEALFAYHATARYALVDSAGGAPRYVTPSGLYARAEASPDGRFLLVDRVHRPFSYQVPWWRFAHTLEILDAAGRHVRTIAEIPPQERATLDTVPTGPRAVEWRSTAPATLVWAEALDGGDDKTPAGERDRIVQLDAPFADLPRELLRTAARFRGIEFIEGGHRALVSDYDRDTRITRTFLASLDAAAGAPELLFSLRDGDRYNDPGDPLTRTLASGERAIAADGDAIFLRGAGWGPEGRRPFLDRYDLVAKTSTRLFESALEPLDAVADVLDAQAQTLLVQRQSPLLPPNFFVRSLAGGEPRAITQIADPAPQLHAIERRAVTYRRADGIDLSFTLYLPPGYTPGTPLPTLVWAYPLEYNDPSVAGQNANSTQTFPTLGGASPVFLALAGYAILDNVTIPIVGDPQTVNDTYVEQIAAGAEAAIAKAVELGVTDPARVAAAGHSYGGFMTANLLAHTRLFRAGIARSGAYNRTLTPFGFQSERRTYWEATELYTTMSPFTYADKIEAPLLLIHGAADDNTGTYPVQSERMFAALKGTGGTARLVMLPHEAHGYVARESVETTLAEMLEWLERWL
jgi:dipeptidyl aminopeptidase/acylaminoacyl peptidase